MKVLFIIGCLALLLCINAPQALLNVDFDGLIPTQIFHTSLFDSMLVVMVIVAAIFTVVALGVFLAVGLLGIICSILFVVALIMFASGLAIFWPFLLIGFVIWLLVADKKPITR